MTKTKEIIAIVAMLVIGAIALVACGSSESSVQQKVTSNQNTSIASALQRLEVAQPTPTLYDSGDRAVQRAYYTAEADPNKIWYLENSFHDRIC